jgi:dTDP-4-amino-4,6-dideoxygalactose transaminase
LALEKENIESRPVWKPMHLQPVFGGATTIQQKSAKSKKIYPARAVGGQIAKDLFNRGLCLPSGTALTNPDLDRIIETILKCRK